MKTLWEKLKKPFEKEHGIGIFEDNVHHLIDSTCGILPILDPSEEQRKDSRISISIPVQYSLKWLVWKKAACKDSSQNGVRLTLEQDVAVGSKLKIKMKLPDIVKPFQVDGIVVWKKPSINRGFECGVVFQNFRKVSGKEKIVHFLADRLCKFALESSHALAARPARSLEEVKKAYSLVYDQYVKRGYCEANASLMHYHHYALLPDSRTFVLMKQEELMGTISFLADSPCGLPLDQLFKSELDALRIPGRKLVEVGLLSLDSHHVGKRFSLTDFSKLQATFKLFKTLFDYARLAGVTDLVIGMHPKHKELYEYLTFQTLGPVRSYPGACGKPALLMRLDIRKAIEKTPQNFGKGAYFLQHSTPEEIFQNPFQWDPKSLYPMIFQVKPVWQSLSVSDQEYFRKGYPGLTLFPKKSNRIVSL